jgi:hypothetical protein
MPIRVCGITKLDRQSVNDCLLGEKDAQAEVLEGKFR